jgi:hypothetical protein
MENKELFLKLAALLGWTNVIVNEEGIMPGVYGTPPDWMKWGISEGQRGSMPNWIRDDAEALHLAVEHGLKLDFGDDSGVYCWWPECVQGYYVDYVEFSDKMEAVRVVIVQTVITKLGG